MPNSSIPAGAVHRLPEDLRSAIASDSKALNTWRDITPLARNEFICWVLEAKQSATRERRIKRSIEELNDGERRPCCWMGCVHRTDKAISPSVRGILAKRNSSSK